MVVSVFSSRELAFMTWSVIVLIWICFSQKLRHSLRNILKAFFAIKLQVLFIGGYIYLGLILILIMGYIHWDNVLIKDCIIFTLVTSIAMIGGAIEQKRVRNNIFDTVKATTIIAFYINVFTFSFIIEFVLLPVIVFLSMTAAYAKSSINPEENKVGCMLESFINFIYLGIIIYGGINIYQNPSIIIQEQSVNSLILPIILTVCFIPYLFVVKLYSAYEYFLIRLKASTSNLSRKHYRARRNIIIKKCGFNLNKLEYVSKHLKLFMYKDDEEFKSALNIISAEYGYQ